MKTAILMALLAISIGPILPPVRPPKNEKPPQPCSVTSPVRCVPPGPGPTRA